MIALLAVYTVAIGAVCALAAWCAERAALLARRPARWTWAAALATSCALPAVAVWRARTPAAASGSGVGNILDLLAALAGGVDAPSTGHAAAVHAAATARAADAAAAFDRPLAGVWAALATVALVRLAWRAVRTRRAVRIAFATPAMRVHTVRRARALVTPTLGPAVLGGWRATLALPAWLWEQLDAPRRRLVFAHEAEHLRSGDPRLLTAAAVAVALAPWSPAGWWMLARLRAAVEIDCDRRVLARVARRAPAPVATYGTLLLDVAARHAATPSRPRLAPALAEAGRSTLERRICQMTAPRPSRAHARSALLALGSVACVAVACELPRPTGLRATTVAPLGSVTAGVMSPLDSTSVIGAEQIRGLLGPTRVAAMRAVTGRAQTVWVIDSANGTRRVIVRGSGSGAQAAQLAFTDAAITVRRYAPGVVAADTTVVAWVRVGAVPSAPEVRVRGQGSLRANLDSILVVVDGRIVGHGQSAVELVEPASIRSVDVLKGALATERYGDAGRAGVVVITRKPGASAR